MIAVCASSFPDPIVSDSLHNSWQKILQENEDSDTHTALWVSVVPITGTDTITVSTASGGTDASLAWSTWSGIASAPDQTRGSQGFANPFTTGNITPTKNTELIISCAGALGGSKPNITGSTAGALTILDNDNFNGSFSGSASVSIASAYQIQTTATTVGASWSNAGGPGISTVIASIFSSANPGPLQTQTTQLPEGFNGVAYGPGQGPGTNQLAATGGVYPYTWTCNSGCTGSTITGSGISLSASGLLTGTAVTGSYTVNFTVTDSASTTATTGSLTLTVATTVFSIPTSTCPAGTQYAAYVGCTVGASGGTSPYTLSYSPYPFASPPEGIAFNTSTGALTSSEIGGMGTYKVQFLATDAVGATANKTITFAIAGVTGWMTNLFPANSIWHTRVDAATCTSCVVDTSPAAPIPSVYVGSHLQVNFGSKPGGAGNTPNGIPAFEVPCPQSMVSVVTQSVGGDGPFQNYYGTGPFPVGTPPATAPISPIAPVEDNSCSFCDRHMSLYQQAGSGCTAGLWEMWKASPAASPAFDASQGWWPDVTTNAMTPQGAGTTDAAGLPLGPALLFPEEVIGTGTPTSPNGTVQHPTRFILANILNYWVWPATTTAGLGSCKDSMGNTIHTRTLLSQTSPPASCSGSGPAGEIYRMKQSATLPACVGLGTCPMTAIILTGFKNYGIILADDTNGSGGSGTIVGVPSTLWVDADLANLSQVTLGEFEPVNVSGLMAVSTSSFATSASGTAPTITSACPTNTGTQGTPYSFTVTATGSPAPTFNISVGALPSGLSMNTGTGVISGTPTGGGTSSFTIQAANGVAPNATQPCSITITALSPRLPAAGAIPASGGVH